ncbi:unnamed protein product [Oncorhynchus mykiss]|uniref:ZP-N domain-containing protein n=1 Tax=Oncorhynchus mykiss TaxID=8022 RepID=A0A060WJX5_ONCMY|nr:unnamed protein product [Oncorhynchus mykiss]
MSGSGGQDVFVVPLTPSSRLELNETVLCTNDLMKVVIPSAFFLNKEPPVYVWDLHLNDPECRGVEVGDDYVFSIKTNLSDCGTIMVRLCFSLWTCPFIPGALLFCNDCFGRFTCARQLLRI